VVLKKCNHWRKSKTIKKDGFTFDMGAVGILDARCFDRFLLILGKKTTDYYELIKLSPAYRFTLV
jgi:phytoene desaturase